MQTGTLIGSGTNINSLTNITGQGPGQYYYYNVVVSDAYGNQQVYHPYGDYFANNLTLYYPFDQNLSDVSANANTGVAVVAPTQASDRFGYANSAYSFSTAATQWLHSTNFVGISGAAVRTLTFWMKANQISGFAQMIAMSYGGDVANSTFGAYLDPVSLSTHAWCYSAPCDLDSTLAITTNWEHWAITYDGTNLAIYRNGSLAVSAPRALTTIDNYLSVGNGPVGSLTDNSRFFDGLIDDVRLYSSFFSGANITNLYNITRP